MTFKAYTPHGLVHDFVDTIFFLGGADMGNGVAFQRAQQTIIINLGANFGVTDIYTANPQRRETSTAVWVNGKQEIPFMLQNGGATAMYAIGIKPGRMPWLVGLPAIETNDSAVEADNWTSAGIFSLREQLLACGDIDAGFRLIEQYLYRMLVKQDFTALDKISWIDKAMHTHTVQEICQSLGVTRKKLRTEAQYYFGGPVKNIQGILRFNNTLAAIARDSQRPLTALHEYYDQAHFINDFKARAGITPMQYRKLCRQYPAIRQTPNFLPLSRETFLQCITGPGQ
jgi:AraC-like DNA-binding protein